MPRESSKGKSIMLKRIGQELLHHIPFTAAGAVTGIAAMLLIHFFNLRTDISEALFYTFHPLHLLFSAIVTTSLYRKHGRGPLWLSLIICYAGPMIIGTLSDAIIPYIEGSVVNISISFELPFIETAKMPFLGVPEWIPVNAAAVIGIAIGFLKPNTKFPHMLHILVSTWASLLYFTSFGTANWLPLLPLFFLFLFLAVWIPCCFSDIVFPILWTAKGSGHEHDQHHH
jgi:hypothetical protein